MMINICKDSITRYTHTQFDTINESKTLIMITNDNVVIVFSCVLNACSKTQKFGFSQSIKQENNHVLNVLIKFKTAELPCLPSYYFVCFQLHYQYIAH